MIWICILALPLVIGQVRQMLIYLADTLMIGRLGTMQLAAAAFGDKKKLHFLHFQNRFF